MSQRTAHPNGHASHPAPFANGSNGAGDRGPGGRFALGNQAARGHSNPFGRQVAALRQVLVNAVTADDVRAVAAKLLEQAKAGDVASARLLLGYVVGHPEPVRDPDSLDLHEIELLRGLPDADGMAELMQRLPPSEVLPFLDFFLPIAWQAFQHRMAAALDAK